ncbi:DUF599 domain-containing protein [Thalassospira marina]|uniref:DUF599 domain-containing protein n=1 Tax=Thalassospira marina TaxID=2048283 RepID=A0A2N3KUW7_9PROT|nr:DUF599 domain-containing protein [Thalassospira marina]AUG52821.1 hypothetical protein CSC3H3_08955 [Thalassospira marina]PKR54352.1 hypothetical protein COO20_09450 [Thalassospira marina]
MVTTTLHDALALAWALCWWAGYTFYADSSARRRKSISALMARNRHRWMEQMLKRNLRMIDTSIAGNLITAISFFSSTTILVLVGLGALLGYSKEGLELISALPYAAASTPLLWNCKVVFLMLIFVYAFFKFTWAFRLSNYCSILIGAAPEANHEKGANIAAQAARMSMMSAHNFNRGIRAYFFALSALAWFYHPYAFMLGASWVIVVLYNREFRSHALEILSGKH